MKKNPPLFWLAVFALGFLADFLFWKQAPGINFFLYVAATLAAAFALLLWNGLRPHPAALWLILPIGFFSASTFFRAESLTVFLAVVLVLLCMALLTVTYLGGNWRRYALGGYFQQALNLLGSLIARPVMFASEAAKEKQYARFRIAPILRGLLFATPILLIFGGLLASADLVFEQRLNGLLRWLSLDNLPELIFRLTYISVIAYALAGVVLHAAAQSSDEKFTAEQTSPIQPFLGFIESSIILGSVVFLFAAFVAVQFQYFFGGNANIHLDGFTYAEYARRGFGELTAVAFFALLMLLALSGVSKRETETQRKIYSALGIALVSLLMVMLVSAFQRLNLYEAAYGFSRLRTYTHVFLIWLGALLLATIALEALRKERAFAFAALLAAFGFAASLVLLNVDAFIVRQNVQRELSAKPAGAAQLDAAYFTQLSDDAIPPLAQSFANEKLPRPLKEKLGAALACIQIQRADSASMSWRSFHLSRVRADAALRSIEDDLSAYQVQDEPYPSSVVTPSGESVYCGYSWD
ncbi:MAG: hypothetical protein Fur002_26000 [Anaerolineales bacterium]